MNCAPCSHAARCRSSRRCFTTNPQWIQLTWHHLRPGIHYQGVFVFVWALETRSLTSVSQSDQLTLAAWLNERATAAFKLCKSPLYSLCPNTSRVTSKAVCSFWFINSNKWRSWAHCSPFIILVNGCFTSVRDCWVRTEVCTLPEWHSSC